MLSFSPLSSTPYSALSSDVLYARAVLSSNSNLDSSSTIRLFESVNFDCFAELSSSLYALREINVYYTVYVTTNKNYSMALNTEDFITTYSSSDFTTQLFGVNNLYYELSTVQSLNFALNVVKEEKNGIWNTLWRRWG